MAAADILPSQDWFLKAVQTQFPFGKKHKPPSSHHPHHHCKTSRNLKLMGRRGSHRSKDQSDKENGGRTTTATSSTPTITTNVMKFNPSVNLVPGQVKILKRGEKFPGCKEDEVGSDNHSRDHQQQQQQPVQQQQQQKQQRRENMDFSSSSSTPLGVEPDDMASKLSDLKRFNNGGIESFSGASFITSPCPSFLPIPSFLQKEGRPQ